MNRITTNSTFEAQIGYCRAVNDGEYLHISGTTGYDYETMTINPDPITQATQCLENISGVLAGQGLNFSHVVRVNYIFPVREDFPKCWPVLRKYFGESPPAATMIVAALAEPEMKLEIEVTAKLHI